MASYIWEPFIGPQKKYRVYFRSYYNYGKDRGWVTVSERVLGLMKKDKSIRLLCIRRC